MEIINHIIANLWELWLIVAIVCLIVEMIVIADGSLYIICFAIGALVSSLASVFIGDIYAQIIIWAVASVLSIYLIRPTLRKYFHHDEDVKKSNADALIGRKGRVSEAIIAGGYGRVAIDGDDWKAVSEDGSAIAKDAIVEVVSRESIIITVKSV